MTPATAIARLFDIIASRVEFTEGMTYAAMEKAGVPEPVGDHAYKFAQIVCGRQLLGDMGISFAIDYTCASTPLARPSSRAASPSDRTSPPPPT